MGGRGTGFISFKGDVQTCGFKIDDDEWDFYIALTRYVEDQSIKAASEDSARGRALGFTMAMLQRRFASLPAAAAKPDAPGPALLAAGGKPARAARA